jgi:Helicase associated domain
VFVVEPLRNHDQRQRQRRLPTTQTPIPIPTRLYMTSATPPTSNNSNDSSMNHAIQKISSPVLLNVYSALVEHHQTYGHPNIPLGSPEGRACDVLRRLAIQGKLTEYELGCLTELQFRFHSLEDVYFHVDFDELLERLLAYEQLHENHYQVPKKYVPDPELGAWVTGLRRLGPENVSIEHADQLNAIGFTWKSARQCGSAFMTQYRTLVDTAFNDPTVLHDPKTVLWKQAQIVARKNGKLSDTRYHYMEQLFGVGWDAL